MNRLKFPLIVSCFLLIVSGFTLYSYTQVDLNLTLSSNPTYQAIQYQLTQIGYFNRPLSTMIFFTILGLLVACYLLLVAVYDKWHITTKQLSSLLIVSCFLLIVSYPAFSHDIFNYIFDARKIVVYHANPWTTTILDFSGDPWTRFMRWTHKPTAYPPGWVLVTLPFYLLGFGKFTLTLLSYKLLGLLSFLLSSWLLLRLGGRRAFVLWSFNPMVLISSLSSAHNDTTMVCFVLLGFLFMKQGKKVSAWASVIYGALVKYISLGLLPFMNNLTLATLVAWAGTLAFFYVREINPWYMLLPLSISLLGNNKALRWFSIAASIGIMYRYYPCVALFSC